MQIEFLITSIIVILLPGTGVIYTLAYGLARGWRASVLAATGCTFGIVPHIAASVAGLAALLHTSAIAFQVVKFGGVIYLFYMAWCIIRDNSILQIAPDERPVSRSRIIVNGFLLNILNPKLSLFFLAFLPQFVPQTSPNATWNMLLLGGVFMALTWIVFVLYGAFASAARRYIVASPVAMRWMRRGFASAFGLLGLRLAFAER